jgi:hypothetical protein
MAEKGRAEQWQGMHVDEDEMGETFLCSISCRDKAATMWGGGHRRHMVTAASPHAMSCTHARVTGASRLSGRCGGQVGRDPFLIFQDFQSSKI